MSSSGIQLDIISVKNQIHFLHEWKVLNIKIFAQFFQWTLSATSVFYLMRRIICKIP